MDTWHAAGEKLPGQDTIQGTFTQSYGSVLAWLEQLGADNVLELTKEGVAHWSTVLPGGPVCTPEGHIVVDVTVDASPAIACKLSVLNGIGAESIGLLSALYKQSSKQRCAELRDVACMFAAE